MKKFTLLLMMALVAIAAWAVPAKRADITHRQKDGTELSLTLVGDEYFHYYVNTVTGEKMELGSDGDFHPISATTFKNRRELSEARRLEANQHRVQRLPLMRQEASGAGPNKAIGNFSNMTGQKKGLVILVNFKDVTFKSANDRTAFDNQFNQKGYSKNSHIGSVKDYFEAQSYGNFSIDFDVVGPVTVSQNMAYYGGNNSSGSDEHPAEMIIEAVKLADAAGVDFTKYDWGGDGYVDQVFVVFAGYNEAQNAPANTIWPHEWTLSAANYYGDGAGRQRIDGKYIDTYACTSELCGYSGSTMDGIGTACHEFSHCLGYPDLYDTSGGDCWGMDAFDLMDFGSYSGPNKHGEVPCGFSAYQRWMAGWLTPTELTEPVTISDMPALNQSPTAYIIYNPNKSTEYLLLENRQNDGYFKYLRNNSSSHGLLVTHVDYNASSWSSNKVNIDTSHERFKYIAADGSYSTSSYPADYFPGTGKVTALTSTSHTSAGGSWFNGTSAFSNMDITNISESGGLVSFDFNGGTPQDDGSRYTITYWINGVKSEWTQTDFHESTTIQEIPVVFNDWLPMGWSLTDYLGIVPGANVEFLNGFIENHSYIPTEDITVYAVYSDMDGEYCTSHPVEENNTITLNVLGSTYGTPWTQTETDRVYTLPSYTSTVTGWTFVGWCASSIDNTSNKPTLLKAGTELRPNTDVTYYAVFSSSQAPSGSGPQFRLVTSPTAGSEYVIVTSNAAGEAYAIDFSNVSTIGASTITGSAVTIADNGGISIASADENLCCTFTYTNNKWQVMHDGKYFVINGSGFLFKDTSTDMYWSDSFGLYGKSGKGNTSYYIHSNGATINNTQTGKADDRVYLFENVNGASVTYYNSNPAATYHTVNFEPGSGSCATTSFTQSEGSLSTELPTATTTVSGWTFAGWATQSIDLTSTRPALLAPRSQYTPTFDATLFAVYTASSYLGAVKTVWYCTSPSEAPGSTFYTITLTDGQATIDTWTQTADSPTFTLPSQDFEGWTFAGWSSALVAQTIDTPAVKAVDSTITPTSNLTLFTVFKKEKGTGTGVYTFISNPSLYVPGGGTQDPQFYFPHIAQLGKPFIEPRFNTDSTGALTFTSSDPSVARVDETTGKVTIRAKGTAIITVTQAATSTHSAISASYMIKVVD